MAARHDTPFPKCPSIRINKNIPNPITSFFVRTTAELRNDLSDLDVRDLKTPPNVDEDEIIVLHDSSSSSNNDIPDISTSMACISLLDSSLGSETSLNDTFLVKSPIAPCLGFVKTANSSQIPRSNGIIAKSPKARPSAAAQSLGPADVLRLYRTQACTELGRLQANVAKWQLLGESGTLGTVCDAQRRCAIAEATSLLAGSGRKFQQAVNAALAATCDKQSEASIAKQWLSLQAALSLVLAKFADIPTPARHLHTMTSPLLSKVLCVSSTAAKTPTAMVKTPQNRAVGIPNSVSVRRTPRIFQSIGGHGTCADQLQTPDRYGMVVAVGQTPTSARSKIPV